MLRGLAVRPCALQTPCTRACYQAGRTALVSRLRAGLGVSSTLHPTSSPAFHAAARIRLASTTAPSHPPPSPKPTAQAPSVLASYTAPLSKTFFRLKLFSLGSLTLATALCPALLFAPGSIGLAGRIGLCCTALATSGASTALIAWIGKPYVSEMRLLPGPAARDQLIRDLPVGDEDTIDSAMAWEEKPVIQVMTTGWRLQPLQTTIYEPSFIRPTSRPFATWELPTSPPRLALEGDSQQQDNTVTTRLVAATRNVKTNEVVGRWWARWTRDTLSKEASGWKSDGQCSEEGKVIRHFSIHEDLLDEDWQVL